MRKIKNWTYGRIDDQSSMSYDELLQNRLHINEIMNTMPLTKAAAEVKAEGLKFDNEKPDLSLLPIEFLAEVSKAMMYGEKKYGRYNFTGGMAWHRIIAASLRHIYAFAGGEDLDPESGVSHLGHAGACILMLSVYFKRKIGEDTREKKS